MNIALFSDTYPPEINGVATSTFNLFNILKKNGHNVYAIVTNPFSNKIEYKDNVLRIPGILLKKLYGYRMAGFYSSKAMKIVREMKLDVIHIQTDAGIGIFGKIAARSLRVPTVYTYHTMYEDYTYYATKGHFDRFARNIVRRYSRFVAEQCTEFISPSNKTKDIIRTYGVDRYVNVIPTGIDFSKFKKENQDWQAIAEFKKSHGLENHFVILSLGRVAKEKSLDICIKGYAYFLKTATFPTKFVIVGGGPARMELETLVDELGIRDHMLFIGAVPGEQVPFYYHISDIFVSASVTETQGLTFMEAMASRHIVLARFDENLSGVISNNETGYFFTNEHDFGEKVVRIHGLDEEKKEAMLTAAMEKVDVFSIERFYDNIMEVYHRAVRQYW